VPTWVVVGDAGAVGELTGLDGAALHGGFADTTVAARWLDDGITPNGASGRGFTTASVHGFDLTFAAPKSVSLLRALSDDIGEKAMVMAHQKGIDAAMAYLHEHAGYTRVHNPLTGNKDLQRLPGLVGIAYQHETSRCGDPHLHTHVIVPNRQARADGTLVSVDSKSLHHEAKAAGVIYQAVVRHELHAAIGAEWRAVDEHSGMAEIAGVTKRCLKAWSRRSTRLREWARNNLVVVDGEPSAQQLAAAQKATRPAKPESQAWAELTAEWRADARGLEYDRAAHLEARAARGAAPRLLLDRARLARMVARIDKPTFTRADLVELVGALLPVDAPGDPRALIDQIVDVVGVRVSAPREAHHREGYELFTVDAVIAATLAPGMATQTVAIGEVPADQMILDGLDPRQIFGGDAKRLAFLLVEDTLLRSTTPFLTAMVRSSGGTRAAFASSAKTRLRMSPMVGVASSSRACQRATQVGSAEDAARRIPVEHRRLLDAMAFHQGTTSYPRSLKRDRGS